MNDRRMTFIWIVIFGQLLILITLEILGMLNLLEYFILSGIYYLIIMAWRPSNLPSRPYQNAKYIGMMVMLGVVLASFYRILPLIQSLVFS